MYPSSFCPMVFGGEWRGSLSTPFDQSTSIKSQLSNSRRHPFRQVEPCAATKSTGTLAETEIIVN
jgi:hypothetical protein